MLNRLSLRILKNILPDSIIRKIRFLRLNKTVTGIFGHLYNPNHYKIEIDITYDCNLKCTKCDRSCSYAPSNESMSIEQIKKFVKESINNSRKWERIHLVGGEPTLNPDVFGIIDLLINYKKSFSNSTKIVLITNGFGQKVKSILDKLPSEIDVVNTNKVSINPEKFINFNIAPVNLPEYKNIRYSNGCPITQVCGIGFTRYGFYPCAVGGAIDRVFGFDIGLKNLPSINNRMTDQFESLCKYCGHFIEWLPKIAKQESMSPEWNKIYKKYEIKKTILSMY